MSKPIRIGIDLHLDKDELNACVQCGLCLSACPTYRVTGNEANSPRGRIALMRLVQNQDLELTPTVVDAFTSCIQCRGCEPACPSGVKFGHLIEGTNAALASNGLRTPWWHRVALRLLGHPLLLRTVTVAGVVVDRISRIPTRLGFPRHLPLKRSRLAATGEEVYLFTGCVMDMWQRPVHEATLRVLSAYGVGATPTNTVVSCCGALDVHSGLVDRARRTAQEVVTALGNGRPVLVNSAGCGAAMKEYGHLLGTEEAKRFSANVFDVHEWLADLDVEVPVPVLRFGRVAVQDPCHLRHVQDVHGATRDVLRPFVAELVDLGDDGLCCGAGGAYSVTNPEIANELARMKRSAIAKVGAEFVASANPGCSMHLSDDGLSVVHPMQIIDWAIRGVPRSVKIEISQMAGPDGPIGKLR